jgi:hypothetical protein
MPESKPPSPAQSVDLVTLLTMSAANRVGRALGEFVRGSWADAGTTTAKLDSPDDEIFRLRRLVGDEDVDTQWRGLSRSDVIALAEEHYAAAEALRADRAALWELLKLAVRTYRENDELALAEWRQESAEQRAQIERLQAQWVVMREAFVTFQAVLTGTERRLAETRWQKVSADA